MKILNVRPIYGNKVEIKYMIDGVKRRLYVDEEADSGAICEAMEKSFIQELRRRMSTAWRTYERATHDPMPEPLDWAVKPVKGHITAGEVMDKRAEKEVGMLKEAAAAAEPESLSDVMEKLRKFTTLEDSFK
jgi:hypothetical protein